MGTVVKGGFENSVYQPGFWYPVGRDKDTLFYCHRLGMENVKLTPDVTGSSINPENMMYHIKDKNGNIHGVRYDDIVPMTDKEAKEAQENASGLFEINLSNINQIKDFLCAKFIPSYNWDSEEQKGEMMSKAKRPRDGLYRLIDGVRAQGHFINKEDFVERMKKKEEAFPWDKFADFLDYKLPNT